MSKNIKTKKTGTGTSPKPVYVCLTKKLNYFAETVQVDFSLFNVTT